MMQDSAVAPGFSPACAALKGGATYVALYTITKGSGTAWIPTGTLSP
jgi:hypothetical protein